MKIKFKSGINRVFLIMVVILNAVILLLFSTKIFTTTNIGVSIGFFLLAIDAIVIVPMLFCTYYEFRDDYLYIHDYPIRAYKIKYEDIFTVEDGDFETKDKSIVALSMDRIAIGYTKVNSDEEEEKHYIFISPSDMNLFLTRLSGRLQQYKTEAEKKAKELSEKQVEHNKKKKLAEKKREELEKESAPEIVEINEIKKFEGFKSVDEVDDNAVDTKTDADSGNKQDGTENKDN